MRIGLSYHGGDPDYDAYPAALHRRADALGLRIETHWLAGKDRPTQLELLTGMDAVLLTGGPDVDPQRYGFVDAEGVCRCSPQRDAVEWELLERLRERTLPMLAICRGAQILNVFHGGSLIPDLREKNAVHRREGGERRVHPIALTGGSLLHRIAGSLKGSVNSSHHQAIDRLASEFRIGALSEDGVVEAFEMGTSSAGDRFVLAVQWHPEGMQAGLPLADRILDGFLQH